MWYKGIRIILDALAGLDRDYRMVFIGDGGDRTEIEAAAAQLGNKCIFTGAIPEREALQAWYTRADLFLFPSAFDTNGLVVREAAAASLPSVLLRGSCAAEDVKDGTNGFLIEESAESLRDLLNALYGNTETLRRVGDAASRELYVSWADAVSTAQARYEVVIDRYKTNPRPRPNPPELLMMCNGEMMEALAKLASHFHSKD